jgi:hypothetical protein
VDYVIWTALFLATSLFWFWILFKGGADWLEGSILVGLLLHFRATTWTAEGIKLFAGIAWLGEIVWFVVGLFSREVRQFFLG